MAEENTPPEEASRKRQMLIFLAEQPGRAKHETDTYNAHIINGGHGMK